MRSCGAYSHECLENEEADNDGLDEKEDGVELVITLVTRDRSSNQAGEIEQAAGEILVPEQESGGLLSGANLRYRPA